MFGDGRTLSVRDFVCMCVAYSNHNNAPQHNLIYGGNHDDVEDNTTKFIGRLTKTQWLLTSKPAPHCSNDPSGEFKPEHGHVKETEIFHSCLQCDRLLIRIRNNSASKTPAAQLCWMSEASYGRIASTEPNTNSCVGMMIARRSKRPRWQDRYDHRHNENVLVSELIVSDCRLCCFMPCENPFPNW